MQRSIIEKPDAPTGNLKFRSKRDVSAMVGCCVRTVDSLMQQGMPHLKLGRRKVRFDLGEVADWLKRTYGTQRLGRENEQIQPAGQK